MRISFGGKQLSADLWRTSPISPYLAYHEIAGQSSKYFYSVTQDQFREQLLRLQVRPVGGRVDAVRPKITFDDGHISQYDFGLPALQESGVQAIFFVTAGWADLRKGYMSWQQLTELQRLGHEVQSHGWSHRFLTACSLPDLRYELEHSKKWLEDKLGTQVNAISLPGGRWNRQILDACADLGYRRVFTSDPFPLPKLAAGLDLYGRLMVPKTMRVETIQRLLDGHGISIYKLRVKHLARTAAKRYLGDAAYRSLWLRFANKDDSQESVEVASKSKTSTNS